MTHTRTHTHAYTRRHTRNTHAFQQRCCFFAVTSVTQPMLKRRKTLSANSNHTAKRRLVLPKTTCRFTKNNVSFYQKQRVVFHRTSALNDTQVAHQWKTQPSEELFLQQCRKSSSSGTQRVAKILISHTFGVIRHPLCKRMLQKQAISLLNNELQWKLWHLWQQKSKNSCGARVRARVRGGGYSYINITEKRSEKPFDTSNEQ